MHLNTRSSVLASPTQATSPETSTITTSSPSAVANLLLAQNAAAPLLETQAGLFNIFFVNPSEFPIYIDTSLARTVHNFAPSAELQSALERIEQKDLSAIDSFCFQMPKLSSTYSTSLPVMEALSFAESCNGTDNFSEDDKRCFNAFLTTPDCDVKHAEQILIPKHLLQLWMDIKREKKGSDRVITFNSATSAANASGFVMPQDTHQAPRVLINKEDTKVSKTIWKTLFGLSSVCDAVQSYPHFASVQTNSGAQALVMIKIPAVDVAIFNRKLFQQYHDVSRNLTLSERQLKEELTRMSPQHPDFKRLALEKNVVTLFKNMFFSHAYIYLVTHLTGARIGDLTPLKTPISLHAYKVACQAMLKASFLEALEHIAPQSQQPKELEVIPCATAGRCKIESTSSKLQEGTRNFVITSNSEFIKSFAHIEDAKQEELIRMMAKASTKFFPEITYKFNDFVMAFKRFGQSLNDIKGEIETTSIIWQVICLMLESLKALHQDFIIHNDIKESNVLVEITGDKVDLKLCDFEFALFMPDNTNLVEHKTAHAGTRAYKSPERNEGVCGYASDMWAMGVILVRMFYKNNIKLLFTKEQFKKSSADSAMDLIKYKEPKYGTTSKILDKLTRDLLMFNPASRPSAAAALEIVRDEVCFEELSLLFENAHKRKRDEYYSSDEWSSSSPNENQQAKKRRTVMEEVD